MITNALIIKATLVLNPPFRNLAKWQEDCIFNKNRNQITRGQKSQNAKGLSGNSPARRGTEPRISIANKAVAHPRPAIPPVQIRRVVRPNRCSG